MKTPLPTSPSTAAATIAAFAAIATALPVARADAAPPETDRKAILAMAGDFKVVFQFEETYGLSAGYKLREPYREETLEKVIVVEDTPERIVLQHLLIPEEGMPVIKHWTQVWTWEDNLVSAYQGDSRWKTEELTEADAKGKWTQRVGQVDDSPRYESLGAWTHGNGVSIWEAASWRPLPRREHTTRDDYNVIVGTNRHILTPDGWVHEQDNTKVLSRDGKTGALARERGCNLYTRTENSEFARAADWWEERRAKWNVVRKAWEEKLAQPGILKVDHEGGEGALAKATAGLVKSAGSADAVAAGIQDILGRFTTREPATAGTARP